MNKLILIRGLPGSGKSTLAKNIVQGFRQSEGGINPPHWRHLEADQFFMKTGVYQFQKNRLFNAHQWCLDEAEYSLSCGTHVVVSNTFTTMWELDPYFSLAKKNEIIPTIILCQNDWGSVHDVPETVMENMRARFEFDLAPLFKKYF